MDRLARQRAATVEVWRADVASKPAGDWTDLGSLALHSTGLPAVYWNGAHLTAAEGLTHLPQAAEWFAAHDVPWGIVVAEEVDADPGTGFVKEHPVMLRDLDELPPVPDLELRWDAGPDACEVQVAAFEEDPALTERFVMPKLVNAACAVVVGYDGPVPVATATLVVAQGVAAVYGVGTVPAYRRQGLGAAVTLAVLHEGRRRGCDLSFLNPSEMGYGGYARLGFADAPPWRIYRALTVTGPAAV